MAPGEIKRSKIQQQKDLEEKMGTVTNTLSSIGQSTRDGSYAKGILGGAASGASIGTSINAGWGTLIGAVVGAGAGAIGTAASKESERKNKPDDSETKKTLVLQNKMLQQKFDQNRNEIDWMTKLRNSMKYR
jgi:outer membrane lipoprotein SlyB